jgi:hypothetical protein
MRFRIIYSFDWYEKRTGASGGGHARGRRLLAELHRVGMVEAATTPANAPAHVATEWLRRGIGPLVLAARVERSDPPPGARPVEALDVEAAMLLVAPLLRQCGAALFDEAAYAH